MLEKTLQLLGIEPCSHCLAARNFTTLPNGPTVVSVLLNAHFSYVNLTVGHNFDFKPDLTLILATAQPYITLESVRLLEKTLQMLGIEPGSYCLAARNFTTLLTVASVYLIAHFSYVNLTVGRNFNFKP